MFRFLVLRGRLGMPAASHSAKVSQSHSAYSTINSKKQQIDKLMRKIGDENSQESQKTMKVIRTIGAGSIVVVLCSLFWASAMSAPVKETYVEMPDLSKDIREIKD